MDGIEPHIPEFLDPVLDFLYDILPPPFYDMLMQTAAKVIAVCTTAYSVIQTIVATRPWEWQIKTEDVLAPAIAVGCVCIVLYIAYRSVLYMIRSLVWTIKWGIIFSAFIAGVGYLMANNGNTDLANGGAGGVSNLASVLFSILTTPRQARDGDSGSAGGGRPRPGAWESFDRHREW
ncbi:hypothetical protein K488DRAFT_22971, partial [Vararia minispora EC-137]